MSEGHDVLIVGAGAAGLSAACALATAGWRVVVFDSGAADRDRARRDLRALAITPASRRLLESWGAWRLIPGEHVGEMQQTRVWERAGDSGLRFDAAESGLSALAWFVPQGVLEAALAARAAALGVVQHAPVVIEACRREAGAASVCLKDGRIFEATLIIGADGAHSPLRESAGIRQWERDTGQSATVATVACERPHRHTATQRFLDTGPVALLPLHDPHRVALVWSATHARSEQLACLDDHAWAAALGEAMEGAFGRLTLASERVTVPLRLRYAHAMIAERLALVGDSAHGVHPLAGQGANLGFYDVAVLADTLGVARAAGRDPGARAALRRYERARKENNLVMIAAGGLLSQPLAGLRAQALAVTARSRPLRALYTGYAAGGCGFIPG